MRTRLTGTITVILLVVLASSMTFALGGAATPKGSTATSPAKAIQETETQQAQNQTVLTIDELEIKTLLVENSTVRNGRIVGITAENVSGTAYQNQTVTFAQMTGTVRIHDVTLENVTIRNKSLAAELALGQTSGNLGEVSVHIATLSNQTVDGVHIESGSVENVMETGFTQENTPMKDAETQTDSVSSSPAFEARAVSIGDITLVNATVVGLQVAEPTNGAEITTEMAQSQTTTVTG